MAMSRTRIRFLVVFSLLEILLFCGLIFGWSSLVFVLKAEGLFEELCTGKVNTSMIGSQTAENATNHNISNVDVASNCFKQDERFNLIFSIGSSFLNITLILSGQMYYRLGTKKTRIFTMALYLLGVLFLAFASPELPWLILPGIMIVGIAGMSMMLSSVEVAVLLTKWSPIYVGLTCGFFDSSVLTHRVVKELFERGVKRSYSFSAIAVLMIVISGLTTFYFPSKDEKKTNQPATNEPKTDDKTHTDEVKYSEMENTSNVSLDKAGARNDVDDEISIRHVICTRQYILQVLWYSIMLLRLFYFLGSVNSVMEQTLNGKDQVSYFTDVMAYTMMAGCVSSYFSGQLLQWLNMCLTGYSRKILPLCLTSGLAVLLSAMTFVTSESALYGTFIILTIFRSFVFSVNMDFIINSFPKKFASMLIGLESTIAGLISLLQYALFVWTKGYHDAVNHVNGVLLGLSVLTFMQPLSLFIDAMRTQTLRKLSE